MRKNLFLSAIFLLIGLTASVNAQGVKPSAISGEVASIDSAKIIIKTPTGDVEAVLSDATKYMSVPPDNPKLSAAVPAAFADISVGDKVLVTGILSDDKKTLPAKAVYLMSKSAIAERQTNFLEDWKKRGTYGTVVNYNPQTNIITMAVRGFGGERQINVKPKADVEYYRYPPNSIEIVLTSSTRSKVTDIELNDQIRVLGNKNADGTEIEAEKIVTGSFKQSGGKIKAINLEKNELIITDLSTNKDVAVTVTGNSILKQFPAEMASRIAMMQAGGGQGGFRPPTQGGGQTQPQQNPQTPGSGAGQGGFRAGGGGGGGIDDSRFPNIKLSDLKVGEAIGILSSKTADQNQVTAIKIFSGVEPFIQLAQARAASGGGRQGGGGASLNIPGLDGGFGGN